MSPQNLTRREWVRGGVAVAAAMAVPGARTEGRAAAEEARRGAQRLSVERLQKWEALGYGMFIHFGMSTFDGRELSDGRAPATLYAPDALPICAARRASAEHARRGAPRLSGELIPKWMNIP